MNDAIFNTIMIRLGRYQSRLQLSWSWFCSYVFSDGDVCDFEGEVGQ